MHSQTDSLLPVIGRAMRGTVTVLKTFARQNETILLSGPTGAGKSRLARWCHAHSGRAGALQTVDLLSIPDELQMGELFGWKKGSFTGANHDRDGCVARAEGGTLFIDEIDKLSLKAQASLLHLLETRQYRVLGAPGSARHADVRFIVGSNADLRRAVAAGRFREDLYYRIYVLPVRVPPLAERRDEIPDWARFMLARQHRRAGAVALTSAAARRLSSHRWPGNLRQLDNVMRRAYALALVEPIGDELCVSEEHVTQALAFEEPTRAHADHELMESMKRAARAFFAEARRRLDSGAPLELAHAAAFAGLVVQAGVEELGDIKETYRVLGNEGAIKSRNYQRDHRRERQRVEQLTDCLRTSTERGASNGTNAPLLARPSGRDNREATGGYL